MAKKKPGASGTYFFNRRVEIVAQGFYVAAIFLMIPAWFFGRHLETRAPLMGATLVCALAAFAILAGPVWWYLNRMKTRPEAIKPFLGGLAFVLIPIAMGALPYVNKMGDRQPEEIIRALILTTYGEPGTEERVNLAGSSTVLVEFQDGTRRRFEISNADYYAAKPRHSYLEVARRTGLVGLVWLEARGVIPEELDMQEDAQTGDAPVADPMD